MKSRKTKAVAISQEVKRRVAERDEIDGWTCCVICGSPNGLPEAHYIARSNNGLGIEENIVTLCRPCHYRYDFGDREERAEIKETLRQYLKSKYPDWNEERLVYRK